MSGCCNYDVEGWSGKMGEERLGGSGAQGRNTIDKKLGRDRI